MITLIECGLPLRTMLRTTGMPSIGQLARVRRLYHEACQLVSKQSSRLDGLARAASAAVPPCSKDLGKDGYC